MSPSPIWGTLEGKMAYGKLLIGLEEEDWRSSFFLPWLTEVISIKASREESEQKQIDWLTDWQSDSRVSTMLSLPSFWKWPFGRGEEKIGKMLQSQGIGGFSRLQLQQLAAGKSKEET